MSAQYIINTSFIVEPPIHDQWYNIFTTKFIPFLRSENFENLIFTRVLTNDNNGHYTYSLQISDSTIADYQRFMDVAMVEYNSISSQLFSSDALSYVSLLKIIKV